MLLTYVASKVGFTTPQATGTAAAILAGCLMLVASSVTLMVLVVISDTLLLTYINYSTGINEFGMFQAAVTTVALIGILAYSSFIAGELLLGFMTAVAIFLAIWTTISKVPVTAARQAK